MMHLYKTYTNGSLGPQCLICGDRSTGKHYGAMSCDGCKGFFRRSIRKNHRYRCRFRRDCIITVKHRNQCRFCRLRKCFRCGMRREAVQNERDRISWKKFTFRNIKNVSIVSLFNAEMLSRQTSTRLETFDQIRICKQHALIEDICDLMKDQVYYLVEWARRIPVFHELYLLDKIKLMKTKVPDQLIFNSVRRSLHLSHEILLGNNCVLTRYSGAYGIRRIHYVDLGQVAGRMIDEVVSVFVNLRVDDTELSCLKAVIFFDPNIYGLYDPIKIRYIRNEILAQLDDYVNDRQLEPRGRFAEMLMALTAIQSIALQLVDQIQFGRVFNTIYVDEFLDDLVLGANARIKTKLSSYF